MTFAFRKIRPPKEWYHNPELQDRSKNTVAILFAIHGVIPPEEWRHRPEL